jgi:hypothetical protein
MYDKLDALILRAIEMGNAPLYNRHVSSEAKRIADWTGRVEFRVTDGRLKHLKSAGKIRFLSKREGGPKWVVQP